MKFSTLFSIALAQGLTRLVEGQSCVQNACYSLINPTRVRNASLRSDCSSFQKATVAPNYPTVTTGTTATSTPRSDVTVVATATIYTVGSGPQRRNAKPTDEVLNDIARLVKRGSDPANDSLCSTTIMPTAVPTYARSACPASSDYASACSCNGIKPTTITSMQTTITSDSTVFPTTLSRTVTTISTVTLQAQPSNFATGQNCYPDNGERVLRALYFNDPAMTQELCQSVCKSKGYSFYGLEYSTYCFCDNVFRVITDIRGGTSCNMACGGNSGEVCGGTWAINAYLT